MPGHFETSFQWRKESQQEYQKEKQTITRNSQANGKGRDRARI